jgi:transcriptional regulator with XRE-family HTH domain
MYSKVKMEGVVMARAPQKPIPARELMAYRAEVKGDIFRQIHARLRHLKAAGFTQKQFAQRLGMNEGQLSRVLKGETDLRLETLSDLARGLGCRIVANLNQLNLEVMTVRNALETIELHQSAPIPPAPEPVETASSGLPRVVV